MTSATGGFGFRWQSEAGALDEEGGPEESFSALVGARESFGLTAKKVQIDCVPIAARTFFLCFSLP
jgi:hypothetical protein